jgi:hypothetical protein
MKSYSLEILLGCIFLAVVLGFTLHLTFECVYWHQINSSIGAGTTTLICTVFLGLLIMIGYD